MSPAPGRPRDALGDSRRRQVGEETQPVLDLVPGPFPDSNVVEHAHAGQRPIEEPSTKPGRHRRDNAVTSNAGAHSCRKIDAEGLARHRAPEQHDAQTTHARRRVQRELPVDPGSPLNQLGDIADPFQLVPRVLEPMAAQKEQELVRREVWHHPVQERHGREPLTETYLRTERRGNPPVQLEDNGARPAGTGAPASTSHSVTVSSSTPPPQGITLSATGYKVKGLQKADLTWSGATSTQVDVFRNNTNVATVANTGSLTDNIDVRGGGSYTYRVCEAGTTTCSNTVTISF